MPKHPGGRPPGSRNKKTAAITAKLEEAGAIDAILEMAQPRGKCKECGRSQDDDFRLRCYLGVLPYGHARLTATKVNLEADVVMNSSINLSELPDELLRPLVAWIEKNKGG